MRERSTVSTSLCLSAGAFALLIGAGLVLTNRGAAEPAPLTKVGDEKPQIAAVAPVVEAPIAPAPAAQAPVAPTPVDDPFREVKDDLAHDEAMLLDVREMPGSTERQLRGAVLFPWSWMRGYTRASALNTIPTDRIVYVYASSAGEARTAATFLARLGFDARALETDFEALSIAFEVTR